MDRSLRPGKSRQAKTKRRLLLIAVKGSISIGILALLIGNMELASLKEAVGRISGKIWGITIAGFLLGHLLSSIKWRMLLIAAGIRIGFASALRAHAAGLFANLCLPSVVGGDVIRAGLVVHQVKQVEAVALGSLADRLNDTLALTLIAGVAGVLLPSAAQSPLAKILTFFAILLPLGAITGILCLRWLARANLPGVLHSILQRILTALNSLIRKPGIGILGLCSSILIQSGFVWLNIAIAYAMDIPGNLHLWLLAWPLAKLVALAPVSLGGIGVREAALAAILAPFGIDPGLAVIQSLCWEAVLIFSGLLAGLYALVSGHFIHRPAMENST